MLICIYTMLGVLHSWKAEGLSLDDVVKHQPFGVTSCSYQAYNQWTPSGAGVYHTNQSRSEVMRAAGVS